VIKVALVKSLKGKYKENTDSVCVQREVAHFFISQTCNKMNVDHLAIVRVHLFSILLSYI